MSEELLLRARLLALMPKDEAGRVIRELLRLLPAEGAGDRHPLPPCSCGLEGGRPYEHQPDCAARQTYDSHAAASGHEWRRARALAQALRDLVDAVAAEVAIHPGVHDRVATRFEQARSALAAHEDSKFPGDDGLPF